MSPIWYPGTIGVVHGLLFCSFWAVPEGSVEIRGLLYYATYRLMLPFRHTLLKCVYPQSDGSLAIIDIDASKGFVNRWVHLFVATEDIHRNDYQWERCFFRFR